MATDITNVWLYYRLSRDDDREQNSLNNQRKILCDYAVTKGLAIVGESFDDSVSGMHFNRDGIEEVRQAAETRSMDAVLVKDLSRLGRHKIQTALFIETLREYGVRVFSVTENIDSFNEADDLIIGFKQILNDSYSKDNSRKIRHGYRQKQKEGLVIVPPFGYFKDKNTKEIVIVDDCAEIIRLIYKLYMEGLGYKRIALHLQENHYRSPAWFQQKLLGKQIGNKKTGPSRAMLWNERTVERILADRSYMGTLVCHKDEYKPMSMVRQKVDEQNQFVHENFYPVIIDKALWDLVQAERERRVKTKYHAANNKPAHRYAGLLRCADCDAGFTAKIRKGPDGVERVEYVCNTYHRMGKSYCSSHRVSEDLLDGVICTELSDKTSWALQIMEPYITQQLQEEYPSHEHQIIWLKQQIDELNEENTGLLRVMAKYPERSADGDRLIRENKSKIAEWQAQLKGLKEQERVIRQKQRNAPTAQEILNDMIAQRRLDAVPMHMLVDKILVRQSDNEAIDIQIHFTGSPDMPQ